MELGFSAPHPAVYDVLHFLQNGLDMGLCLATIKSQISAISSFSGVKWTNHKLIAHFRWGVRQIQPFHKLLFLKWDLLLVLDFLMSAVFQAHHAPTLFLLTIRTVFFLVVLT